MESNDDCQCDDCRCDDRSDDDRCDDCQCGDCPCDDRSDEDRSYDDGRLNGVRLSGLHLNDHLNDVRPNGDGQLMDVDHHDDADRSAHLFYLDNLFRRSHI